MTNLDTLTEIIIGHIKDKYNIEANYSVTGGEISLIRYKRVLIEIVYSNPITININTGGYKTTFDINDPLSISQIDNVIDKNIKAMCNYY